MLQREFGNVGLLFFNTKASRNANLKPCSQLGKNESVPVSPGSSAMPRLQPFSEAGNRACLPYSCFHKCLESKYE